jgi:predicted sulfurtransferase
MMQKTRFIPILSIIVLMLSACSAQASPATAPMPTTIVEIISSPTAGNVPLAEAEVPRISPEKAKAAMESGAAIVIDVRSREAYAVSHIPGAINIQLGEFETNITSLDLDKEQWIITYCT